MTEATRGQVRVPASAAPGGTITVTVGTAHAGETVDVWLHSAPVHLGRVVVATDGTVRVALPADAPAGAHRVAVVAADGTLIGWDDLRITGAGRLAATGAEADAAAAAALALIAAGTALVAARRLRRSPA
jgi:hypothetical protein